MLGTLSVEDVRDMLHQAMLGLSRMQIYAVISEAEVGPDGQIAYASFIPKAAPLISLPASRLSWKVLVVAPLALVVCPDPARSAVVAIARIRDSFVARSFVPAKVLHAAPAPAAAVPVALT